MENMEIEMIEETGMDVIETVAETGLSIGKKVAIGGLLAAAIGAVGYGIHRAIKKHKAKKALRLVDDDDIVEVTDEQIEEVTK